MGLSTNQLRIAWSDRWAVRPPAVTFLNREPVRIQPEALPALKAMESVLYATGYGHAEYVSSYYPRAIGGYTCDMQNGGRGCSIHGYGLAVDIDAPKNPYYRRPIDDAIWARIKFTKLQVAAVKAIRTNNGKQAWKWLGDSIGDTMHWQINCTRADLETGIDSDTVLDGGYIPPPTETLPGGGHDMNYVKYSDGFGTSNGDADVKYWQTLLVALGQNTGGVDGKYGGGTKGAVRAVVPVSDGEQIGPIEAALIHVAIGKLGSTEAAPVDAYTKAQSDGRYPRKGATITSTGKL